MKNTSECKYCGDLIYWESLFGRKHPFNLHDGVSHMDTCREREPRRLSLRMLGDVDTFYRKRWRERFLDTTQGFNLSELTECGLPEQLAMHIGWVLRYAGGPFHYAQYTQERLAHHCYGAAHNEENKIVCVQVDAKIMRRLGDYLAFLIGDTRPSEKIVYSVSGIYLVYA